MHKSLRLLVLLIACLVLIAPVRAQGTDPADNPLENAVPITPLGIVGMIASSVVGSGGLLWLWSKARIESDKQRREADLLAIKNAHEEQMTDLKGQLDERKRSDGMMTQLLSLYGDQSTHMREMVNAITVFGDRQIKTGELLTDQTSVILTVGQRVDDTSDIVAAVKNIVLQVLDESRTQTAHGQNVIQRLDGLAADIRRVADRMKTKELTPVPEGTGALITPPPPPNVN